MRSDSAGDVGGDAVLTVLTTLRHALSDHAAAPGRRTSLVAIMSGDATDLSDADAPVDAATRIDRIAALEQLRSAVAAAQQAEMRAFAQDQIDEQIAVHNINPKRVGRGIADQIALACKISPATGSRRLNIARALETQLPATQNLLRHGAISEDIAERVVSETKHLDPDTRRAVDKQIAASGIDHHSPWRAGATAKRLAYAADPARYVDRGRTARRDRRVTLRPAPDTMAILSALVPVEQGAACLAALRKHADLTIGHGDDELRSRDQVIADTLVERLTGQAKAADVNVEVGIVMPLDAVLDPDTGTAEVLGHSPIPAGIAHDILATTAGKKWWRRLWARRKDGPLVDADPTRRLFTGVLKLLVRIRDGDRCTDPYCDAPARHIDHVHRARDHGPTSLQNGRAVCMRGNLVREMPGWDAEVTDDGLDEDPHTVRITTPTGHTYENRAGP